MTGHSQGAGGNGCRHGPTPQHRPWPGHAMRAARSGLRGMRGDKIRMPLTTAEGAVTRQLYVPFTPGTWCVGWYDSRSGSGALERHLLAARS